MKGGRRGARGGLPIVVVALLSMGSICPPAQPTPPPSKICVPPGIAAAEGLCDADRANEPNESLVRATTGLGCSSTAQGALASTGDVDVYRTGACGGSSDRKAMTATIDLDARLCLFARCALGRTNVYGCYQSVPGDTGQDAGLDAGGDAGSDAGAGAGADLPHAVHTDSGFLGCCRQGPGSLGLQVQCLDLNAQAEGYVWVEWGTATETQMCAAYSVKYQLQ